MIDSYRSLLQWRRHRRRDAYRKKLRNDDYLSDQHLEELQQSYEHILQVLHRGSFCLNQSQRVSSHFSASMKDAGPLSRKLKSVEERYGMMVGEVQDAYDCVQHERWRRAHEAGRVTQTFKEWEKTQVPAYRVPAHPSSDWTKW
jgi:hypothetical protein